MLLVIAWQYTHRTTVLPASLSSSNGNATSILLQMGAGDVLSSLAAAEDVTAQLVWSDEPVYSPTSPGIKAQSEVITVGIETKARIVAMLSSSVEYQDGGQPCLCYFQPQLRLSWPFAGHTYCVLISGISHGEIQSFRDGTKQGTVRDGRFIPAYLEIMDRLFPDNRLLPGLRRLQQERQKGGGTYSQDGNSLSLTP
jgi:hypothetical protein